MCDGYYWPISFSTRRSGFYRDANICRSSCGEEAKLFYHPSRDGDVKEMVDLTGRAYSKMPTAYLYRKSRDEACKCKPDPWAQSELDRHQTYAAALASWVKLASGPANDPVSEPAGGMANGIVVIAGGNSKPVVPDPVPAPAVQSEVQAKPAEAEAEAAPAPVSEIAAVRSEPVAGQATDVAVAKDDRSREDRVRDAVAPTPAVVATGKRPERRAARRLAEAGQPPPKITKAKQTFKGGSPFGLGAGSQKSRWPGD